MDDILVVGLIILGYVIGVVTTWVIVLRAKPDGVLHFTKDEADGQLYAYCEFKEHPLELQKKKRVIFKVAKMPPRE